MKIILLNPPARFRSPILLPPLGLAYLAAGLKQSGYRVGILDAPASGMKLPDVVERLRREKPEILGIGGMTPNFDLTREALAACRPHVRHAVIGGPHVSALGPELIREIPEADFLVAGEGEETLSELVRALDQGSDAGRIPGVAVRSGAPFTPRAPLADLDRLPFPARELLPNRVYRHPAAPAAPVATLVTSRGCPYPCSFCDKAVFGEKLRSRSPENVLREIERIGRDLKIRELIFYDDNFFHPRDRAVAILDGIRRSALKVGFRVEARVDGVDPELLALTRAAGGHTVAFGVESANPEGLRYLGKGFAPEAARRALRAAREAGLETIAYFILGIPGETRADMERTIRFARELDPTFAQFSVLSPTPGSRIFPGPGAGKPAASPGLQNPFDQDRARPYLPSTEWEEKDLRALLKRAYRKFYLRPLALARIMGFTRGSLRPTSLAGLTRIFSWLISR